MRTIDHYLDAAIGRLGLASSRALAGPLGVNPSAINQYRTRRAWPSASTMRDLARLAGIDEETALVELNIWREQDAETRAAYMRILAKISSAAAALAMLAITSAPSPARAERYGNELTAPLPELYIMRQMAVAWRRLKAALPQFRRIRESALNLCSATVFPNITQTLG